MSERILIVNADDLGQSDGVNRGIIDAHERGVVTSASLMVLWPASFAAAAYARSRQALSVGLHLDLGEWMWSNGSWRCRYQRVDSSSPEAAEREVRVQLECFRDLLGCDPTHIDSHQHVHRRAPVRSIVERLARELEVPLRHVTPGVRYYGDFYGQTATAEPLPDLISVSRLVDSLLRLRAGVTELSCHPGYAEDLESMYQAERRVEVQTLCAPEVRDTIANEGIRLASFRELVLV